MEVSTKIAYLHVKVRFLKYPKHSTPIVFVESQTIVACILKFRLYT